MAITSPNNAVSKARQALFDRGFKAKCERIAASTRADLGLGVHEPLDLDRLAKQCGAEIWDIANVPGLSEEALSHLSSEAGDEWSAVTVMCEHTNIIVINPSHVQGRATSDLAHELSHLMLKHDSGDMFKSDDGLFMLREFDDKQEAEADWLAGSLLLPRKALEYIRYNHLTPQQVIEQYAVSEQLYEYRCRMTAINRQYAKAK